MRLFSTTTAIVALCALFHSQTGQVICKEQTLNPAIQSSSTSDSVLLENGKNSDTTLSVSLPEKEANFDKSNALSVQESQLQPEVSSLLPSNQRQARQLSESEIANFLNTAQSANDGQQFTFRGQPVIKRRVIQTLEPRDLPSNSSAEEILSKAFDTSYQSSSFDSLNSLISSIFSNHSLQTLPDEDLLFGPLPSSSSEGISTQINGNNTHVIHRQVYVDDLPQGIDFNQPENKNSIPFQSGKERFIIENSDPLSMSTTTFSPPTIDQTTNQQFIEQPKQSASPIFNFGSSIDENDVASNSKWNIDQTYESQKPASQSSSKFAFDNFDEAIREEKIANKQIDVFQNQANQFDFQRNSAQHKVPTFQQSLVSGFQPSLTFPNSHQKQIQQVNVFKKSQSSRKHDQNVFRNVPQTNQQQTDFQRLLNGFKFTPTASTSTTGSGRIVNSLEDIPHVERIISSNNDNDGQLINRLIDKSQIASQSFQKKQHQPVELTLSSQQQRKQLQKQKQFSEESFLIDPGFDILRSRNVALSNDDKSINNVIDSSPIQVARPSNGISFEKPMFFFQKNLQFQKSNSIDDRKPRNFFSFSINNKHIVDKGSINSLFDKQQEQQTDINNQQLFINNHQQQEQKQLQKQQQQHQTFQLVPRLSGRRRLINSKSKIANVPEIYNQHYQLEHQPQMQHQQKLVKVVRNQEPDVLNWDQSGFNYNTRSQQEASEPGVEKNIRNEKLGETFSPISTVFKNPPDVPFDRAELFEQRPQLVNEHQSKEQLEQVFQKNSQPNSLSSTSFSESLFPISSSSLPLSASSSASLSSPSSTPSVSSLIQKAQAHSALRDFETPSNLKRIISLPHYKFFMGKAS